MPPVSPGTRKTRLSATRTAHHVIFGAIERPLTIGIDARAAREEIAGGGRVVPELLRALAARPEPHRYRLCARGAPGGGRRLHLPGAGRRRGGTLAMGRDEVAGRPARRVPRVAGRAGAGPAGALRARGRHLGAAQEPSPAGRGLSRLAGART